MTKDRRWHVNVAIEGGMVVEVASHSAPGNLITTIGGRHWLTWFGPMTYEESEQMLVLARKQFLRAVQPLEDAPKDVAAYHEHFRQKLHEAFGGAGTCPYRDFDLVERAAWLTAREGLAETERVQEALKALPRATGRDHIYIDDADGDQ